MIKKVGKRPASKGAGRKPMVAVAQKAERPNVARKVAGSIPVGYTLYRYFIMECGHYGCREVDEKYSAWRSNRYDHMCEICGGWRKVAKKPKVESLPDTPLF